MMKDFNTYILNKLNEDAVPNFLVTNKDDNVDIVDINKDKKPDDSDLIDIIDDFRPNKDPKSKPTYPYRFAGNDDKVYYVKNKSNLDDKIKKLKNRKNKDKTVGGSTKETNNNVISTEDMKSLGRAIAYRSSLGIAKNPENLQAMLHDLLEDTSDYSISQLMDISDVILLNATAKTIIGIKKREKDNKDIEDKCNKALQELQQEDLRNQVIEQVKKDYSYDFNKNKKLYEQAFNDGLKEQKKKMGQTDYEWEDPITHEKPSGIKQNLKQYVGKGLNKLENFAKNLKNKIPAEHNLENDMARLAMLGVTAMFAAAKGINALVNFFSDKKILGGGNIKTFKETATKTKFDEVKNAINDYKKEFDAWKAKKTKNESFIFEAEENNDEERNQLLSKLNTLLYDKLLKYYFGKLLNISTSFDGQYDNYFIKEIDEKWYTKNNATGNLTYIEDNSILMLNFLKYTKTNLMTIFDEFKNDSITIAFKSIPANKWYNESYRNGFKKWYENIKTDYGFSKILNVYNKEVMKYPTDFKTYKDFIDYINKVIPLISKVTKISVLKNETLSFNEDELVVNVPGIIVEKDYDDTTENTNEIDNIKKELENLRTINSLDDFKKSFATNKETINKTYEQIKELNKNLSEENKKKLADTGLADKTDTMSKLLYIQLSKSLNKVEAVIFDKTLKLILEAEEEKSKNTELETLIKDYNDLINADINFNNISEMIKKKDELENKITDLVGKITNEDIKKSLDEYKEDPMALLYALNSSAKTYQDTETEENNEIPAEVKQDQDKINQMIIQLSDHVKDNNFMKLIDTVADENKIYNEKLKEIFKDHKDIYKKYVDAANILGKDINNQIIPSIWLKKKLFIESPVDTQKQQESWNQKRLLSLLTEALTEDLLKQAIELVDSDLEKMTDNTIDIKTFKNLYTKWVEKLNNIIEKIKEENNEEINKKLDNLKKEDPLKRAAACVKVIETFKNNNAEQEQNQESGGNPQNS